MTPHFLNELQARFAGSANRPALVYQGRAYAYGQLERHVGNSAALLQQCGMGPGDRIAVWTAGKLPFLLAHLGVLWGGGISLPLNPRYTAEEMRHFLRDSGARLVVAGTDQVELVEQLRPELPELKAVVVDETLAAAPDSVPRAVAPNAQDPCLMVYSSGTTGWPKGVVHSHANLAASLHALRDCWRVTQEDVIVNTLPLFHIHGLSFAAHLSLLVGGCMILEDAFHPQESLKVVGKGTVFMAVPTMYYRFLEEPGFAAVARTWTKVRLFTCGSAPIRPEVLPELEQILGRPVINRYGMTEAHVIASLPLDGPWPQGSVGLPLDGIELRVLDEKGQAVGAGEIGRIHVRGPNLFREYWQQPEATRKAFADGWFDTGDLGTLAVNGFLTLVGRSNDLIITNGYNVYPQVVERVINSCPGVRDSAVIGLADARRGERVVAAVVRADPDLDDSRLLSYCAERLVDYQRPRVVVFMDALPRNALGKVLRNELRERLHERV